MRSTTWSGRIALAAGIAAMLTLAACGGGDSPVLEGPEPPDGTAVVTVTGSLTAQDQTGDGTTLRVATVTIDGSPGFVAVHEDANGSPGPVVGHAAVNQGTTTNLVVELDEPQESGDFWPMLHVDDGEVGTYEFDTDQTRDTPVTGPDGRPVMQKVTLTVE